MDVSAENRIKILLPILNEKQRRLYLATEAKALGYGGISQVSRVSGVSRLTISQGIKDRQEQSVMALDVERSRRKGGGRKKTVEIYPDILADLESIIEPHTKGNPENPLLWTSKSVRKMQQILNERGVQVSFRTICDLLRGMGYSLQSNKKDLALKESHPDRNAQFEYINEQAKSFISEHEPVISIDAKKKENIGNFKL
jgi:transposase